MLVKNDMSIDIKIKTTLMVHLFFII